MSLKILSLLVSLLTSLPEATQIVLIVLIFVLVLIVLVSPKACDNFIRILDTFRGKSSRKS
jgi:hypothetical protein